MVVTRPSYTVSTNSQIPPWNVFSPTVDTAESWNPSELHYLIYRYPVPHNIDRYSKYFDVDENWPTSSFCRDIASQLPENMEVIYPVFLPFENKGLRYVTLFHISYRLPRRDEKK